LVTPFFSALTTLFLITASAFAQPTPVTVVAIGASNTWGWGVAGRNAYPERLQDLLKGAGYDARVINAGVIIDTTAGMRRRIDAAVPDGTDVVILQPGGNDLRFFGSYEQRTANIEAMVKRLTERKIAVIVYDPVFPPAAYQWDRIHLTADAHSKVALELLPQVKRIIDAKAREGRQR
jgi:acyl-CoA thioesterase-1